MIAEHKDSELFKFLIEIVRSDHIDNQSNLLLGVLITLSLLNDLLRLFPQLLLELISFSTFELFLFSGRLTLSIRPTDSFCEAILAGTTILVIMSPSSSSLVISVGLWLRITAFLEAFLWQRDHFRLTIYLTMPVDICGGKFFANGGVLEILLDQLEACLTICLILSSTDLIEQLL